MATGENNIKQFFQKITSPIEGYDSTVLAEFMRNLSDAQIELFLQKDRHYGGSWQKDGLFGAWLNLKRKIDRLMNMYQNGDVLISEEKMEESVVDTLSDLINYTMLFMYIFTVKNELSKKDPKDWDSDDVKGFITALKN